MLPLLEKITEHWYLTEPAIFQLYCSHRVLINNNLECPLRSGHGRIEINPTLFATLPDREMEERLRTEVLRIFLKHPYCRKPEGRSPEILAAASDMALAGSYTLQYYRLCQPGDLDLPRGKSYEWYANNISLPEDGQPELFPSLPQNEAATYTALWTEDEFSALDIDNTIRELTAAGTSWGSVPAELMETIKAGIGRQADYRTLLHRFHRSLLCGKRHLTRMRPNRRHGFEQLGSRYDLAANLLIAVDVSGSINSRQIELFYGVINGFFKYGISTIDILQFDCGLKQVTSLKKAAGQINIYGRGGTSFQEIFDYITEHPAYDGLLIFTDGYGPQPRIPKPVRTRICWVCDNKTDYLHHRDWMAKSGTVTYIDF